MRNGSAVCNPRGPRKVEILSQDDPAALELPDLHAHTDGAIDRLLAELKRDIGLVGQNEVARRLRVAAERHGLKNAMTLTQPTISRMVRGETSPTLDSLQLAGMAVGLRLTWVGQPGLGYLSADPKRASSGGDAEKSVECAKH